MAPVNDLTGQRFTKLLVLGRDTTWPSGRARWLYRCDCGKEGSTYGYNLLSGSSTSCGCLTRGSIGERSTTHGHRKSRKRTPLLQSWGGMWQRCTNPKNKRYKHYGGRGIKVCDRWKEFENFVADMGEKPEGLTLERKDVNGHYEPGNCVWADHVTQANNRQHHTKWMVDGRLMTQTQLQKHWGLSYYLTRKKLATLKPHEGGT